MYIRPASSIWVPMMLAAEMEGPKLVLHLRSGSSRKELYRWLISPQSNKIKEDHFDVFLSKISSYGSVFKSTSTRSDADEQVTFAGHPIKYVHLLLLHKLFINNRWTIPARPMHISIWPHDQSMCIGLYDEFSDLNEYI